MKYITNLILAFVIAVTSFSLAGISTAVAGQNCDRNTSACEEFLRRQNEPSYKGVLAPTTDAMVCFFPLHRGGPTALVIREGKGIKGPETGVGFRIQPEKWSQGPHNRWYRETCLKTSFMLAHRSRGFTICGERGHVYFSTATIDLVLRKGRIGVQEDPACMFSGTCSFH